MAQVCFEIFFPLRSNESSQALGYEVSLRTARIGAGKTLLARLPSIERTSRSHSRDPSSLSPIGMSIAMRSGNGSRSKRAPEDLKRRTCTSLRPSSFSIAIQLSPRQPSTPAMSMANGITAATMVAQAACSHRSHPTGTVELTINGHYSPSRTCLPVLTGARPAVMLPPTRTAAVFVNVAAGRGRTLMAEVLPLRLVVNRAPCRDGDRRTLRRWRAQLGR